MTHETDGQALPREPAPEKPRLHCNFCGKSQYEVRALIAGPIVFICDECVGLSMDIIREQGFEPQRAEVKVAALQCSEDYPFIGFQLPRTLIRGSAAPTAGEILNELSVRKGANIPDLMHAISWTIARLRPGVAAQIIEEDISTTTTKLSSLVIKLGAMDAEGSSGQCRITLAALQAHRKVFDGSDLKSLDEAIARQEQLLETHTKADELRKRLEQLKVLQQTMPGAAR